MPEASGRAGLWRVAADTGGTFTDAIGIAPDGSRHRAKTLSSGALRVRLLAIRGERWEIAGGPPSGHGFLRGADVRDLHGHLGEVRDDCLAEGWIEVGATARRPSMGAPLALHTGEEAPVLAARLLTGTTAGDALPPLELRLGTTRGTNALLERKGARVALFLTAGFRDLPVVRDQKRPDLFARVAQREPGLAPRVWEIDGRLAADGSEVLPLDRAGIERAVEAARASGCEAAAVSLLHAYQNPEHEEAVLERLREAGFRYCVGSAELRPFIHYLHRTETVLVDATLGPILEDYLGAIGRDAGGARIFVMTSGGGLAPRARFRAKDSLLSGPAGGVAGAAAEARRLGLERILSFDMGGTSTDVARWAGDFAFQEVQTVGPARVLGRSVRLETVAAGGGSICRVHDGRLLVGPESAGAQPGPACYGAGGPLTVTDLNLLLGRLDPSGFSIPVDREAARAALHSELEKLDPEARGSIGDLLEGWLAIANLRMAQAMREVSVRDGYDPADHALVAFGGAGGMHACAVAEILGLRTIVFPDNAGLLSAEGIAGAALEATAERQWLAALAGAEDGLARAREELLAEASSALVADGVGEAAQETAEMALDLRLRGQESVLTVPWEGDLAASFRRRFEEVFGYAPADLPIEVVTLRVRLRARRAAEETECFPSGPPAAPSREQEAVFGGRSQRLAIHERSRLQPGETVGGPALVIDPFSTLVIAPGWEGRVGTRRTVRLDRVDASVTTGEAGSGARPDAVERELLLHRFFGLVGEMGEQLRRTALSPNIRERLDFSCALLDREGRLLVNAPHIPVHLGALGECVRAVLADTPLRPGDVLVTNHPAFGGSHLPDVTVLQGVFVGDALLAVLATRAHHAEWGGRRPGSMPAEARTLVEEGVVLAPMRLFDRGTPHWDDLEHRLRKAPFPSRAVTENLADLQGQVAALRMGEQRLREIVADRGRAAVAQFLGEAGALAAATARRVFRELPARDAEVRDTLDDGTPLAVRVQLKDGRLRIDFSGSGPVHAGNLNATPAIVRSAVLYVVRLLVDEPVPLNEGLLEPVELILPRGLLRPEFPADPTACPAVVGGNVETSQRLVDLLTAALGLCANGPGTMNNVLFGDNTFGAYETIGSGIGAGPEGAGGSGMHAHMSNTAITDPEVLEFRYPVRLWRFALRNGSGGGGRFPGGDGLVREYEWLRPLSVSLLTQRRSAGPRGLAGGADGRPGLQAQRRPGDADWRPLPGIHSWDAEPGERLRIETPGGGGWGRPGAASRDSAS